MAEGLLVPGLAALFLKKRAPLAGLLALALGGGYAASLLPGGEPASGFCPSPPGRGPSRSG